MSYAKVSYAYYVSTICLFPSCLALLNSLSEMHVRRLLQEIDFIFQFENESQLQFFHESQMMHFYVQQGKIKGHFSVYVSFSFFGTARPEI